MSMPGASGASWRRRITAARVSSLIPLGGTVIIGKWVGELDQARPEARPSPPRPDRRFQSPEQPGRRDDMYDRPYDLGRPEDGYPVRIRARGNQVLSTPMINRGTAFTLEERAALGLTGLLPGSVSTIDGQLRRVYAQYLRQ